MYRRLLRQGSDELVNQHKAAADKAKATKHKAINSLTVDDVPESKR
jgi:hypothetical protein